MSANPQTVERPPRIRIAPAEPKTQAGVTVQQTVHAEIQHIQRIINGANKRLERLCEQIAEK